jgi:heme exporter protein D
VIPDYLWVAFALLLLWIVAWVQTRNITRKANLSSVEAERMARENAKPLGNADWVWPER